VLVLVRHGESEGNAARLLLGRLESPLTDVGRAQATAVAKELGQSGQIGQLISSPLGRALKTAEILARGMEVACGMEVARGIQVEVDPRWIEVDYGEYDGARLAEVPHEVWQKWRADTSYRPPGGESLADVGRRVRSACEELFAAKDSRARSGEDVVVVSHVSPIKAAVAWALGLSDSSVWRLYLATGSVTRIAWGVDGPVLHAFNTVPPS